MPKIQESTIDPDKLFNLDGLDYQKGNWGVVYHSVEKNEAGEVNEDVIMVGVKDLSGIADMFVTPVLVSDWTNSADEPYEDLQTLLTDLAELLGFNQGGGGVSQDVIDYISSIATPQIIITSAPTYTLIPTRKVVLVTMTGTATELKLPPIAGNEGLIVIVTNDGSLDGTVVSNTGGDDIWVGQVLTATTPILAGAVLRFTNDGESYKTQ